MPRRSKKEDILRAACALVREQGASKLTLDAVAARVPISKGGLLYHFGTKAELIRGMVGHFLELFDERLSDDGPAPFLESYVRATTDNRGPERTMAPGVLAAVAEQPDELRPVADAMKRWSKAARRPSDPALAAVVQLAADGLWYNELFGVSPLRGAQRRAVVERLLSLSRLAGDPTADDE